MYNGNNKTLSNFCPELSFVLQSKGKNDNSDFRSKLSTFDLHDTIEWS